MLPVKAPSLTSTGAEYVGSLLLTSQDGAGSHVVEKGSPSRSGVRGTIAAFWTDLRFEGREAGRTWREQGSRVIFGMGIIGRVSLSCFHDARSCQSAGAVNHA